MIELKTIHINADVISLLCLLSVVVWTPAKVIGDSSSNNVNLVFSLD